MSDMSREDVERLVRIETKLDDALTRLVEDREEGKKRDEQQDLIREDMVKRIGALENWRYAVGGALLISIGSIAGTAINAVPK